MRQPQAPFRAYSCSLPGVACLLQPILGWLLVCGLTACDRHQPPLSANAELAGLTVSRGTLMPAFDPAVTSYTVLIVAETTLTITPTASDPFATVRINDQVISSSSPSASIPLQYATTTPITVVVTAPNGLVTTYLVSVSTVAAAQRSYIKAFNTETDDIFGSSLARDGDTLVVGAPQEDSQATGTNGDHTNNLAMDSGAVYVFTRDGDYWRQQAYLKASNSEPGDLFGSSVAISGNTIVVGAPGEDSAAVGPQGNQLDNSMPNSGAAYVFRRSSDVWTQEAYLKASNPGASDRFGSTVAAHEDTLAIAAYQEDSAAIGINGNQGNNAAGNSGAVYVFLRGAGTWAQQAYLKASNTGAGDWFGFSLALEGDTLAVGADAEDSNAVGIDGLQTDNSSTASGAVYIFTRTASTWTQQAYVKASNTGPGDAFGHRVALSGEILAVSADAEDSAAMGIDGIQADNSASNSGAVYVFVRNGTTWTQQAYIKASNTNAGDFFGASLDLEGDTLVVGADGEASAATGVNGGEADNTAIDSGAVYVFTRQGTGWTQQAYLKASNSERDDRFGAAVALAGQILAVGAPSESGATAQIDGSQVDNGASESGAVYLFSVP